MLTKIKSRQERIERLVKLQANGYSQRAIAKGENIGPRQVRRDLATGQVGPGPQGPTPLAAPTVITGRDGKQYLPDQKPLPYSPEAFPLSETVVQWLELVVDEDYLDLLLLFFPEPWAMLSAYIDESGTGKDSPAMCVAGVLFEKGAAKRLNREWKKVLRRVGIGYFHTVDCVHGKQEFEAKSKDFRDEVYLSLLGLIGKHIQGGAVVFTVPEDQFNATRGKKWNYSQYTTCAFICIHLLLSIARELGHQKVAFFIESGHKNMSELDALIKELRKRHKCHRCGSHSFVGKKDLGVLQAGDVLAYEMAKHAKDKLEDSPRLIRKSSKEPSW